MRNFMNHTLLLLLLIFATVACDVHHDPVGGEDVALTLHLRFDKGIVPWHTIEVPTRAAGGANFQVRYTLRLFRYVSGTWERTPAYETTFYGDNLADPDCDVELSVAPANYRVAVWTDCENSGKPYYDASDFGEIQMAITDGNDEYRAAWFCADDLELAPILTVGSTWEQTLHLVRPHARYRVIATDKDEFLSYWASQLAQRSGAMVKDIEALDINKFHVRYTYPQYLPSAFSIFADRPVDARTNISFDAPMVLNEDGTVSLGFDYVLVGQDEGSVVVTLTFYDENWEAVSSIPNIEIPLKRSALTTVTGKILTHGIASGISIDPTYDGEYNIVL